MQLVCENETLVAQFTGKNCLLDGRIERISIFEDNSSVCVDVEYRMRISSEFDKIYFKFMNCKEYSFYFSSDYYFYNVELVKLFKNESGLYYISFDPKDELDCVSDDDQDYILCDKVLAYID